MLFQNKKYMNEENKKRIRCALQAKNVVEEVRTTCQSIVKDYLETIDVKDRELKYQLRSLVSNIDFGVDIQVKEFVESQYVPMRRSDESWFLQFVAPLLDRLIGRIGTKLMWFIGILCCLIPVFSLIGAVVIYYLKLREHRGMHVPLKLYEIVLSTTADELVFKVETICGIIKKIAGINQLEGHYCEVLRWLQDTYSNSNNSQIKDSILGLLDNLYYELVNFKPEYTDFFDVSQERGLSEMTTTRPAVRNELTGEFVLRGHVVCPRNEKE